MILNTPATLSRLTAILSLLILPLILPAAPIASGGAQDPGTITCPFQCVLPGLSPSNAALCSQANGQMVAYWQPSLNLVTVTNTGPYGISIVGLEFDPAAGIGNQFAGKDLNAIIPGLFYDAYSAGGINIGESVEFSYSGTVSRIWITVRGNGGPNKIQAYQTCGAGCDQTPTPEPDTAVMLSLGLIGCAIGIRRRVKAEPAGSSSSLQSAAGRYFRS